jgi:hypothetical protein
MRLVTLVLSLSRSIIRELWLLLLENPLVREQLPLTFSLALDLKNESSSNWLYFDYCDSLSFFRLATSNISPKTELLLSTSDENCEMLAMETV